MNFTVNGAQVDLLGEAIQISNLEQIQPGDQVLDEIIINPTTVTTDSGDIQFILNSDLDAAEELIQAEEEADQGSKGIKVELEYNIDGIMGSDLPNIANYGVQPQYNNAQVQIVEQPAANKLRFRYECEGRAAGALTGASSTNDNRTFPTIKVIGYQGPAVVVVSCVTDKEPFRAHPHNLVGKQLCKKGVCSQEINVADMTAVFTHLGIQCVKKKDAAESLKRRQEIRVDPFKHGFAHGTNGQYNLNQVRLCFQVFLRQTNNQLLPVDPVVSDVIYDAKAHKDLNICNYSDNCAPIEGGKKILLFCEKISRDDIEIRFSYTDKNGHQQILKGHFTPNDVHHQVGISFTTPAFPDQKITEKVHALMFLHKVSKGTSSNEIDFYFEPSVIEVNNFVEPAPVPQRAGNLKRNKAAARAFNNQQEESDSSRLAKPAQKKNPNLANSGGCMVIKSEDDEGASGGGFIDRLIDATDSMAKSGTISQKDLKDLITNNQSSGIVDIPSDQIISDPDKLINEFNPGIWDELSDSMQRTGISDNRSKPKQNSQLDTPDVSMEQSKSSRMNNLNK